MSLPDVESLAGKALEDIDVEGVHSKKACSRRTGFDSGEGEIRTRGELPHACFQDRYLKPLGHLSITLCIVSKNLC